MTTGRLHNGRYPRAVTRHDGGVHEDSIIPVAVVVQTIVHNL